MDDFYYDEFGYSKRDAKVDEAKEFLKQFFEENKKTVFYMKQLEVMFEKRFFHWITGRALGELIAEKSLRFIEMPLGEGTRVKFLFHPQCRYYRRAMKEKITVIREYSDHRIARACGRQAEVLFLNALINRGFVCNGENVNEYKGERWERTDHNLDFIIEKNLITYGCEVKNTFDYIDRDELSIKLRICEHLGVKPLFIMRYSPKSYNNEIIGRGGYVIIFEKQIYPFGREELVKRIGETLGMPVDCPWRIPGGIIDRFMKLHNRG